MPSQEFYAILEMIVYPDVIEPENLRVHPEHKESGHVASHEGCQAIHKHQSKLTDFSGA
jgi:hypothetical protein